MEIKHRCNQIMELGFPFGKLFAQDWEGDVTIVMSATLNQVGIVGGKKNTNSCLIIV